MLFLVYIYIDTYIYVYVSVCVIRCLLLDVCVLWLFSWCVLCIC